MSSYTKQMSDKLSRLWLAAYREGNEAMMAKASRGLRMLEVGPAKPRIAKAARFPARQPVRAVSTSPSPMAEAIRARMRGATNADAVRRQAEVLRTGRDPEEEAPAMTILGPRENTWDPWDSDQAERWRRARRDAVGREDALGDDEPDAILAEMRRRMGRTPRAESGVIHAGREMLFMPISSAAAREWLDRKAGLDPKAEAERRRRLAFLALAASD